MATTTNFGWETPDDTDLVKDGAAAMRTLGNSIDTSFVDLKGGTTGQVLSKASNTDLDFTWVTDAGDISGVTAGTGISGGGTSGTVTITNSMATALDAKGDLIVGTGADTFDRLAVGTNNFVLTADSSTATGLKWAAGGSTFAGASAYNQNAVTCNNNTETNWALDAEYFDTDAYHSTSTNNNRFTVPTGKAGKYLVTGTVEFASNATGYRGVFLYKNAATQVCYVTIPAVNGNRTSITFSWVVDLADADYVYLTLLQNSGGSLTVETGSGANAAFVRLA